MRRLAAVLILAAGCADVAPPVAPVRLGYAAERPGGAGDDPVERPRDLSGRSVKTRRVRMLRGTPEQPGTAAYFIARDPWLAWQRGRELLQREFAAADGVFGDAGRLDGKLLDDGATRMMSRDHASSCISCHNVPWRDLGAGTTIAKNAGSGRNTPHVFGGGLVEMLGLEIREELLALADADRNGWISLAEAAAAPPALVRNARDVEFGAFADADGDGRPDLNPICFVWYLDAEGRRIPWARSLKAPGVAGYGFEVQVFGHGQRERLGHGGIAGTLRAFAANAFDIHSGLQACDPTMSEEPRGDGLARVSLCGAQQFFSGTTRDRGLRRDARGVSLDDPDRDGVLEEICEGDLDLAEFHQLNLPRPAELRRTPRRARGRELLERSGCTACHIPDWKVRRDRRYFDLEVVEEDGELRGRLHPVAPGGGFAVRGLYSDLRHHDVGERFHEVQFDGSRIRRFRTPPLWGVGSTAPYGHDGADLSLDAVIRRHGGEALESRRAYEALEEVDRDALLDFLGSLVLYSLEGLPCDIDGDGRISAAHVVAGRDTGRETFNPEWLFRVPGEVEGWVSAPDGGRVYSRALRNVDAAYGSRLEWIADRDRDGFPDVLNRR